MMRCLFLLVICLTSSSAKQASPVVEVTGGAVIGSVEQSANGRDYYSFKGIPFAGFKEQKLRFYHSSTVIPWSGTRLCVEDGPVCAQGAYSVVEGTEDCLHLSVYAPMTEDSRKLPVLVWLPGGAFVSSGAKYYDPSLLMDRDVVLVVPQYRLGYLGFLYTISEAADNFGMVDQVRALQWVQKNIGSFGGDPEQVTLGGDCAGGASALYHMISPMSKGLFHRVVSVSGSPLSPWAKHPDQIRSLLIFANFVKCPQTGPAMYDCFRELPIEEFLEAQMHLLESRDVLIGNAKLAPAFNKIDEEKELFLVEKPIQSFHEGRFERVPVLLITSKDVGNYMVDTGMYDYMMMKEEEGDKSKEKIKKVMTTELILPDDNDGALFNSYFSTNYTEEKYDHLLTSFSEMFGDVMYNAGTYHTKKYLQETVPTYLLRFDFTEGPHTFTFRHPVEEEAPPMSPGADHGDELFYFLPQHPHKGWTTEDQRRVSHLMLDTVESFVVGSPNLPPSTPDDDTTCSVISPEGSLGKDLFLPPRRFDAIKRMFSRYHASFLNSLEDNKGKDEL